MTLPLSPSCVHRPASTGHAHPGTAAAQSAIQVLAHAVALAGIEGSACLDWNPERWREALAPHLAVPDPRVDGRPAAERFSADRMAARVVAAWQALLEEAA